MIRRHLIGRCFGSWLRELILQPCLFRREGETEDCDVIFAQHTDDVLGVSFAPVVLRLAEKNEDAARTRRPLSELSDAKLERIEDGCSVISRLRMQEAVFQIIDLRSEAPLVFRLAVKGDERYAVGRVSGDVIEHGGQLGVVLELAGGRATGLHENQDGKRLR
jgi:hypothetical protein